MIDNSKEYILCAAVMRKKRTCEKDIYDIEIGYRHGDIYRRFGGSRIWKTVARLLRKMKLYSFASWVLIKATPLDIEEQGFFTSYNRFVDRHEAMKIAIECGQVKPEKSECHDLTDGERKVFGISEEEDKDYWRRICRGYAPLFSEDLY